MKVRRMLAGVMSFVGASYASLGFVSRLPSPYFEAAIILSGTLGLVLYFILSPFAAGYLQNLASKPIDFEHHFARLSEYSVGLSLAGGGTSLVAAIPMLAIASHLPTDSPYQAIVGWFGCLVAFLVGTGFLLALISLVSGRNRHAIRAVLVSIASGLVVLGVLSAIMLEGFRRL